MGLIIYEVKTCKGKFIYLYKVPNKRGAIICNRVGGRFKINKRVVPNKGMSVGFFYIYYVENRVGFSEIDKLAVPNKAM